MLNPKKLLLEAKKKKKMKNFTYFGKYVFF